MEQKRILIVDDDFVTALSLSEIVESMGHICVGRCGNSEQAVEITEKERPDIAMLDINIEGKTDGIDTAEILNSRFGVHVVFITAYSDENTLTRVKSSRPFGYILKPFSDQNVKVTLTIAMYQIDLERTLREKDELLQVALSATKIGIWKYEPIKKYLFFDANAAGILGLENEKTAITTDTISSTIHKDDYTFFLDEYNRALAEKGQFEIDIRIVKNGKEIRWVRNKGVCSVNQKDGDPYLTGSIVDITDRKLLEDKFLNIYEANRQEMGQQIHDELGQQLTGLTLLAESLVSSLEDYSLEKETERARKITQRAYGALEDVRRIARNLYPVQITPQGFEDAVSSLASDAEALGGIPCSVENRAGLIKFNNTQATQIYYIVREAINNAIRHSKASMIKIRMFRKDDRLIISVFDNGIGIPQNGPRKGIGLNIMEFRANMFKGNLRVGTGENGGSEVTISVRENASVQNPDYSELQMENSKIL